MSVKPLHDHHYSLWSVIPYYNWHPSPIDITYLIQHLVVFWLPSPLDFIYFCILICVNESSSIERHYRLFENNIMYKCTYIYV